RTVPRRRGRDPRAFRLRTPGGRRGPSGRRAPALSRLARGVSRQRFGMTMRRLGSILIAAALAAPWLVACSPDAADPRPAAPASSGTSSAQEVLRPERAYPYRITADGERLSIRFDVGGGYYLYREQVGFHSE